MVALTAAASCDPLPRPQLDSWPSTIHSSCMTISCQDGSFTSYVLSLTTAFPLPLNLSKEAEMPHKTHTSRDTSPHRPRSLIHIFTITLCITLSIVVLVTLLILNFLNPDLVVAFISHLKPVVLFIIESSVELFALYLLYSLAQAIHLCYYMMTREDERNRHNEQVFGHAKVWFVDEW